MGLSDASEKIPSDTIGDRPGDLQTSSAAPKNMVGNKNLKEEISWRFWNTIRVMAPRKEWKSLSVGEINIARKPMVDRVLWVSDTIYSVWNQACYTVIPHTAAFSAHFKT
jgi:hypothetical protein